MSLDWGSVPDWVAGVGSTGALVIAALAWRTQVNERHEASVDARRHRQMEIESHARQVTAWTTNGGGHSVSETQYMWFADVHVLNTGNHALTDVRCVVTATVAEANWSGKSTVSAVLVPQRTDETVFYVGRAQFLTPRPDFRNDKYPIFEVTTRFTDVNGVRWLKRLNDLSIVD